MKTMSKIVKKNIEGLISAIIDFLGIELEQRQIMMMVQFVLFCVVGVSSAIVMYVTYLIVLCTTGSMFLGNAAAFITSTSNSFLWNRNLVFEVNVQEISLIKAYIKNMIAYVFTGLFMSSFLLYLWVNICGISKLIAPIINVVILTPINFILNKIWTFAKGA